MARLTNAQLSAELEALRVYTARLEAEAQTLRTDASDAQVIIDGLNRANATLTERCRELEAKVTRPRPTPEPTTLSTYRQALAAAREHAMRTGRTVKVGA